MSSGFRDAGATVAAIVRGRTSSRDVLEEYLDRIERHAWVNAVVTVDAEHARAEADAADAAVRSVAPLGPLHGLPITI
ncbi:amidase family protein, partial [Streptomyces brasiliscabiei]|uniref:amidase family protein n=1 Tax=Streptomyces brasiliscabiei TaxID=2736302 RepID=UPI003014EA64